MADTEARTRTDMELGLMRALNACENCDGDLDFAIFIIKRDLAALEKQAIEVEFPKPYFICRCGVKAFPLTDDTVCKCSDIYAQEWTRVPPWSAEEERKAVIEAGAASLEGGFGIISRKCQACGAVLEYLDETMCHRCADELERM